VQATEALVQTDIGTGGNREQLEAG